MSHDIVIAGGGIGALESLLALQALAGDRVNISVLTPTRHLTYRALSVAEPFGGDPAPRYDWEAIARDRGVRWVSDALEAVHADTRQVETRDGPPLPYEALVLALGARPRTALPGALPFSGPRDVAAVRDAIERLRPGRQCVMAFVVPEGVTWTLPLYELALQTAAFGRRRGLDLDLEIVTREAEPLGVFGRAASAAVAQRLAGAGIRVRTGTFAQEYEEGRLWLELEGPLDVDLVIALPALSGPDVVGLPVEDRGFVPVDRHGRVPEVERVWAVGDMTTRPLRQGGLTAQQADVAAADIASSVVGVDVTVKPYKPRLHGLLLTADEPLFLERRPSDPPASEASDRFLWWPPHKIVGRHLGPYLESRGAATR